VITDLRMPEMEGDELARQVRAVEPDVKVLHLMSHADLLLTVAQLRQRIADL
jgi:FixJ family two-component response regulator